MNEDLGKNLLVSSQRARLLRATREVPGCPDGQEVELVDGAEVGDVAEVEAVGAPLEGRVAVVRGPRDGRELQAGTLGVWKISGQAVRE